MVFESDTEAPCSGVVLNGKLKPGIQPEKPMTNTNARMPASANQTHLLVMTFFVEGVAAE